MAGHVPNNEVISWFKKNNPNLFISLSSYEGIPVSIMESMSFGIPVIATAVGGVPEIVNNDNGYLLESDPSAETVAEKITEFFNLSIEEKNQKRNFAYKTWEERYNAEINYRLFIKDMLSL